MQRVILAIVTVGLLIGAGVLYFARADDNASSLFYSGLCMRAGLVCGALWLAFPQVLPLIAKRPSPLTLAMILGVMMIVINPRYAPLAAIIVVAIGILQAIKWLFTPFSQKEQTTKTKEKRP